MPRTRTVAALLLVLVYSSLVVNYERVAALMAGDYFGAKTAAPGILHYAREATAFLLVAVLLAAVARHKTDQVGRVTLNPWVVIITVYVAFLMARTVLLGYPAVTIGYGMRPVLLVLIVAALRHVDADTAAELLHTLARRLKLFVAIQLALVAYQVATARSFFGTTAFGPRPWGTLASPNNLAVAALGLAVLYAVARPRRWGWWLAACFAIILVSGTRTGLLGAAAILAVLMFRRLRGAGLLLIPAAGLGVFLLDLLSSQAVSGRQIDLADEGRLSAWPAKLAALRPDELLFGRAFGAGANAAQVGATTAGGASDSQFFTQVLSTGLVGLLILAVGLLHLWLSSEREPRWLLFPSLLLATTVYNVAEYYPANILLAFVAGVTVHRCTCRPVGLAAMRRLATAARGRL